MRAVREDCGEGSGGRSREAVVPYERLGGRGESGGTAVFRIHTYKKYWDADNKRS